MLHHLKQLLAQRGGRQVSTTTTPPSRSPLSNTNDSMMSGTSLSTKLATHYRPANAIADDLELLSDDIVTHVRQCLHGRSTHKRLAHVQTLLENPASDPNAAWDTVLEDMASHSFPPLPPLLTSDLTVGKWQWKRYIAESGLGTHFHQRSAVGARLESTPSAKLLLELPYDIVYRLQAYLDSASLGRIRQTCRQLSAFPMDCYGERQLMFALTHTGWEPRPEAQALARRKGNKALCHVVQWRTMIEAVRCLNVAGASHMLQTMTVSHADRYWYTWALFLAIDRASSVTDLVQSQALGQILHLLLLHPSLHTHAWFLLIPAFAQVQECLRASMQASGHQLTHTLYRLMMDLAAPLPVPAAASAILSIDTRLLIGIAVLSNVPERLAHVHAMLTHPEAATTAFQRATVDHWMFLFSVQSGRVALVRRVLQLVEPPQALAVKVALEYARKGHGEAWRAVTREIEGLAARRVTEKAL